MRKKYRESALDEIDIKINDFLDELNSKRQYLKGQIDDITSNQEYKHLVRQEQRADIDIDELSDIYDKLEEYEVPLSAYEDYIDKVDSIIRAIEDILIY